MRAIILYVFLFCLPNLSFAAKGHLFEITRIIAAPKTLAYNGSASAVYSVKNNTKFSRPVTMQPIAGIEIITTTTNACDPSVPLPAGASCLLNLRIIANQFASSLVSDGPVVCSGSFMCSQAAHEERLHILRTASENITGNKWLSVLVAQNKPPIDIHSSNNTAAIHTYAQQIHDLAPAAEQVHLRFAPIKAPTVGPASTPEYLVIYQNYADLSAALYTAYANNPSFQVGYHPDNSKGSVKYWDCPPGPDDWQCVLNYTLIAQNNINKLANPTQKGQGYTIFSIEQSYLEPVDPPHLEAVKACLNPPDAAPGAVCPVQTIASPVVKYGDVLPSYGDRTIYGSDKLDYGYPQYYNLVESISAENGAKLISTSPDSYFPADSAANCIGEAATFPYNVIDANLSHNPIPKHPPRPPLIPCFTPNVQPDPYPFPANDVFTYQALANPVLAAAYDAYLMSQLPPISEDPDTNGATVYITFSGEPQFLGSTGWTFAKIDAFNQRLNTNFSVLKGFDIIPKTVDTSKIKYAIWNFEAILTNNN